MFGIFNTLHDAWHEWDAERKQVMEKQIAEDTARLLAAAQKTWEVREKKIVAALAEALAENKHFVTLSEDGYYNLFVAYVTALANAEKRVVDVKFHSYTRRGLFIECGKATLTLRQVDV